MTGYVDRESEYSRCRVLPAAILSKARTSNNLIGGCRAESGGHSSSTRRRLVRFVSAPSTKRPRIGCCVVSRVGETSRLLAAPNLSRAKPVLFASAHPSRMRGYPHASTVQTAAPHPAFTRRTGQRMTFAFPDATFARASRSSFRGCAAARLRAIQDARVRVEGRSGQGKSADPASLLYAARRHLPTRRENRRLGDEEHDDACRNNLCSMWNQPVTLPCSHLPRGMTLNFVEATGNFQLLRYAPAQARFASSLILDLTALVSSRTSSGV